MVISTVSPAAVYVPPGQTVAIRAQRAAELALCFAPGAGQSHPVRVIDPACGSGNFLVPAAHRIAAAKSRLADPGDRSIVAIACNGECKVDKLPVIRTYDESLYIKGDAGLSKDTNRYEGWMQYAAALGNGIASYELAVHYRRQGQPQPAAQFEARSKELGYTPPPSLDNTRK